MHFLARYCQIEEITCRTHISYRDSRPPNRVSPHETAAAAAVEFSLFLTLRASLLLTLVSAAF